MEGWGYAPATGGMRPPTAMAAERIHVYEILEPVSRGGPGRVCRARVAEAGGPLPLDSIVALRTITESEAGGIAVLQELVKDHGTARRISSHAVASPADFGVSSGPQGKSFWSVARWANAALDAATQARIVAAMEDAIRGLEAELDLDVPNEVRQTAGLPSRGEAQTMLAGMRANLWSQSEAVARGAA